MHDILFYSVLTIMISTVFVMPIMCIYDSDKFKPYIFCSVPVLVFVGGIIALSIIGAPKKYCTITQAQYNEIVASRINFAKRAHITWKKLMRDHLSELRKPGGLLYNNLDTIKKADNQDHVAEYLSTYSVEPEFRRMLHDRDRLY